MQVHASEWHALQVAKECIPHASCHAIDAGSSACQSPA